MRLIWLPEAKADLREIINFIAARNQVAAHKLLLLIETKAEQLALYPYIHRLGRIASTREAVVHPNYILIYRVKSDEIDILSGMHARQNYP
ncbi:type II toxin-antitoxin system RelE/ParE family toxin [Sphingomonas endolithica]|uniref:type II toxin-antitoxin system RelE/ParE family toxin n=1 Tax=Sphingomonas endolithica TaxID=2972485 RepID=UPI0021AEC096|nr:type II toxin-antitoxin system RelE/ParE family toxin [Sphingomonas sp. ZFBP2030]